MTASVAGRFNAVLFTVIALLLGTLSYVIGVLSPLGQEAEAFVLRAANFTPAPPAPLNLVSVPAVALVLALIGVFAFATYGVRRAVTILIAASAAIVLSQLLKQVFLSRPGLFELDAPNTFPSGHMTVFAAVVAALLWVVPSRARAIIAVPSALLLGAVGWQLLAYGWHRPSDLLGSLALVLLVFSLASLALPAGSAPRPLFGRPIGLLLVLAGVGSIIAGVLLALWSAEADETRSALLLAGELGVIGASSLTVWAFGLLASRR